MKKPIKKCFAILLVITLTLTAAPLSGLIGLEEDIFPIAHADASESFGYNVSYNGVGTIDNPYQVTTPEQLYAVRNDLSAHYIQTNNIDLAGVDWVPIGTETDPFVGMYNGNGYTISSLTFENSTDYDAIGLFGYSSNSILKNININGCYFNHTNTMTEYFGCIVGYGNVIENCKVFDALVNINSTCAGGIAGYADSIQNCNFSGTAEFYSNRYGDFPFQIARVGGYFGGVCGYVNNISMCYNLASVTATSYYQAYLGGIVGFGDAVSNCWNSGDMYLTVNGPEIFSPSYIPPEAYAGGISGVGKNVSYCYNTGEISNRSVLYAGFSGGITGLGYGTYRQCYSVGALKNYSRYPFSYVGDIIGLSHYVKSKIDSCYKRDNGRWAGTGSAKSKYSLSNSSSISDGNFEAFDFDNIWAINPAINGGYPYLVNTSNHNWYGNSTIKIDQITEVLPSEDESDWSDTFALIITPYDAKECGDGKLAFPMTGVTATTATGDISLDLNKKIAKNKVDSADIVLKKEGYLDYVIPQTVVVATESKYVTMPSYFFRSYMQPDPGDGKPYISTVFGRQSGLGSYLDITAEEVKILEGKAVDVVIAAGNLSGQGATYYLSQDEAHRVSNRSGIFTSTDLFSAFDYDKPIYAYVVRDDGVVTALQSLKLTKQVPMSAETKSLLEGSTISLIGKDGQKIKLDESIPLVGEAELSLEAFKFPIGVDIKDTTVKISLGIDLFTSTSDSGGTRENVWADYKKNISTLFDNLDDASETLSKYKKLQEVRRAFGGSAAAITEKNNAFNLETVGYIEAEIVDGNLVMKEACVNVEGKFTFKYSQQGAVWVIPTYLYAEASAAIGLESTLARQIADTNIPLDFGFKLSIEPALKIGGGVGVDDVVSAGLYGQGSLPYENDFTARHHILKLKGSFGVEAELLVFKGNKDLFKGETTVFDTDYGSSAKTRFMQARNFFSLFEEDPVVVTTTTVADRDYAENTSNWQGELASTMRASARSSAVQGLQVTNMETSIFSNAQPEIVTLGDDRLLAVWSEDDTTRDEYNRMRLVYSIYDGSTWSEPLPVSDDGYLDGYPTLVSDGENAWVAWQKIMKTVTAEDAEDLQTVLQNSEIMLSAFDASTDTFQPAVQLTDNAAYDYMPTLTVEDGAPVVYYASAEDPNAAGGTTLYRYNDGSTEAVKENLNYLLGILAKGGEVSYIMDENGNTADATDINVYTYTDGETTAFDKAGETVAYGNGFYGTLDGEEILFVSDMTNIYYEQSGERKAVLTDERALSGNFTMLTFGGEPVILWTENNETLGNGIYYTAYRDGAWTAPVPLGSEERSLAGVHFVPYNGSLYGIATATSAAIDEETGAITEGSTDLVSLSFNGLTDLSVYSLQVLENQFTAGEDGTFDVYLTNEGITNIGDVQFTVTDTLGTSATQTVAVNLPAGESGVITLTYPVPEAYAATTLTVTAQAEGDSNTENDSISTDIGKPDLAIEQTALEERNTDVLLRAIAANTSAVQAKNTIVQVRYNDLEAEPAEEQTIGDLTNSQYADLQILLEKEKLTADENGVGKVYITVVSDEEDADTSDNTLCVLVDTEIKEEEPEPPVIDPPTTEPEETEPPITEPPVTEPPTTEPPVTEPPVTEPPVTEPPVTEPPATEPPATEPPVTVPPVTDPPEEPSATVPSTEPDEPDESTNPPEEPSATVPSTESTESEEPTDPPEEPSATVPSTEPTEPEEPTDPPEEPSATVPSTEPEEPEESTEQPEEPSATVPSTEPVESSSDLPSDTPSDAPSDLPSEAPSERPTQPTAPTTEPDSTDPPATEPSEQPSTEPSTSPSTEPPVTEPTEPSDPAYTLGDINGDNRITSADARLALRAAVRLEVLSDLEFLAADADGDGQVRSSDARLILRAAIGLEKLSDEED